MTIAFEVPGEPVPKKRPRVVKGRTFTPPQTVEYEQAIAWRFKAEYQGQPLEGPLRVWVTVREVDRPVQRQGDLDNYLKSALDALNGLAWKDDRQVVDVMATVNRHAYTAGMFIEIETLSNPEWIDRAPMRGTKAQT